MLARKVITVVAAGSFAVIVLVFGFVFREAMPFFFSPDRPAGEVVESYGDAQETYRSDPSEAPESSRPGLEMSVAGEEAGVADLMGRRWESVS